MSHTIKFIMVTAAALFIGTASVSFAEIVSKNDITPGKMHSCLHQRGMGKFRGGMGMFPAAETLSEEQINRLEALRTEFRNNTRDLRQELRSKRLALIPVKKIWNHLEGKSKRR